MNKSDGKSGHLKYVIFIFIITFFIAAVMYLFSQIVLENIKSIIIGFILLLIVILIGIMFDVVGTAIAVANPSTFRAKASCKLPGAKKSLHLINNADKVANICNDVIGDICGTVSGGIGAALVYIVVSTGEKGIMIASVVMTGIIASLTVGGKALGKNFAINNADFIIWNVGKILDIKALLLRKKESKI